MLSSEGHLEGMLDRDPRTVFCAIGRVTVRVIGDFGKRVIQDWVPGTTSPLTCRTFFWKRLLRLKNALKFVVYITVLSFPLILSAPISMSSRTDKPPKWLNPCGSNGDLPPEHVSTSNPQSVITTILRQALIAQHHEDKFSTEFAEKIFHTDNRTLHKDFRAQHYVWLPSPTKVGKEYLQQLPEEVLKTLQLDETLLSMYENLQRIAVGVEQIVWDEEDHNGILQDEFRLVQHQLHNLLCEVHSIILDRNLRVEQHVTRDIMPNDLRHMKNMTSINVRNWVIYRDYLNMLEYIHQVFTHFGENLAS